MEQADYERQAELGEIPVFSAVESVRLAIDRRQAEEGELWSVLCDNVQQGFMTSEQAETAFRGYLGRPH